MTAQQNYELAQRLHREGRFAEAEIHYREVVRLFGDYVGALVRLGEVCFLQNKYDAAVEAFQRAVAVAPRDAAAQAGLGCTLNALGRCGEAITHIETALVLAPDRIGSRMDLANALRTLGRTEEAVAQYEAVLAKHPDHVATLIALGAGFHALWRTEQAITVWRRALELQPERADLHIRLGTVLQDMEQHEEAAEHFRAAAELLPDQVAPRTALARSLSALGRREEAAAIFEAVVDAHPENADAPFEMGKAYQRWGRFDDARRCFENALTLQPGSPALWYAWVTGARIGSDDPAVTALERMATVADRYSEADRVQLHFALAKAYDDLNHHEDAFAQWLAGHAIQRRLTPYDEADELGLLRRIGELFSAEYLAAQASSGDPSDVPVFIVGMPRSGTTLVEQVLASHPDVFGAGEAADLARLYDSLNAGDRELTCAEMASVGARYVERLRRRAPDARRITNKMPGNFAAVGLIATALPRARIIHVRRDPADTCFSCWTNLFNTGHLYTHDLGDLGRYYRAYEKLMAHWRRALPEGVMIEVAYEDLVGNLEAEARRLVAACGLAWDPACLDFHKTERPIETASTFQVRQPLYRSAIGRAAPYQSWLRPLKAALAEVL